MLRFLFFMALLLVSLLVEGQVCTKAGGVLRTQAEVDAFGAAPGCTSIIVNGDLSIVDGSDILSLQALAGITEIIGDLNIGNLPNLTSLVGLQNVVKVERLRLHSNPLIQNFTGLEGLEEADAIYLDELSGEAGLVDFTGLSSLVRVNNFFRVFSLSNLVSFNGLGQLEYVGALRVNNVSSSNFSIVGLNSLETVATDISVSNNPGLAHVEFPALRSTGALANPPFSQARVQIISNDGLETILLPDNLTSVGVITIQSNPILSTITGGLNLVTQPDGNNAQGGVSISGNVTLTNIDGLEEAPDIGRLFIRGNTLLATCGVPMVCSFIENGGTPSISLNAPGCNSVTEVEAACLALPVTWRSFAATAEGKDVRLNWSTAWEENNVGYTVEHSLDGIAFNDLSLHLRPRPQNADGYYAYDWRHAAPVGGTHYYRIRQEDLDGMVSYSEVRLVELENETTLQVYPTVVTDAVTIESSLPQRTIRLLTLKGEEVLRRTLWIGVHQLDMTALPPGMYLLDDGEGGVHRLVRR